MGNERAARAGHPAATRLTLALLAVALLAAGTTAPAQFRGNGSAGPEAALELARRLLGPWGDPGGMSFELTPQALPRELPDALPLPEGFEVVGSLANYGPDGELLHAQVVLNRQGAPEAALQELRYAFASAGWNVRRFDEPTGFVQDQAHVTAQFCPPGGRSFVHVNAFLLEPALTDLRLEVNGVMSYDPCQESDLEYEPPLFAPMPTLTAPAGSTLVVHGGNYLPDQSSSSAVVRTDQPADELLHHFESQLEAQGWARAGAGAGQQSTWNITHDDRQWRGTLAILDLGGGGERLYYTAFVVITPAG